MRDVKVVKPVDLEDPALRAMVEIPLTHRMPPLPPQG